MRQSGLEVRFDRGAWVTCLVVEEGASWVGRGADAEGALLDALRRMVPSPLLRARLIEACARTSSLAAGDGDGDAGSPVAAAPASLAAEAAAEGPPEPGLEPAADAVSAAQPEAPAELRSSEAAELRSSGAAEAPGDPPPYRPAAPAARAALVTKEIPRARAEVALPRLAREEALAAADALLDDVRAMNGEVSQLARPLLRLTLLGWIGAGRALQDRTAGDGVVTLRVGDLASAVARYAKLYWPGSVPALQLHATPGDCRRHLGCEEVPRTWQDVVDLAERAALDEERRPGSDEDGWFDAGCLRPRPRAPEAMLDEVCGRLRNLTEEREPGALEAEGSRGEELAVLASKLRWLRGAVLRPERWGEAMGRLRRIADRPPGERTRLALVLDEGYRPPSGSWARELGQDPEEKERRRARRDLLRERPRKGCTRAEMTAWLVRALDVLSNPELAPILSENVDVVAAIQPADMDGRRPRARLRKLQELLSSGVPDAEQERAMRAELARADAHRDGSTDESGPTELDPEEELRRLVLPHVRGKRLLCVSNRADPNLVSALEAGLEPASLDWLVAEPRRQSAYADRIDAGRYDFVLCATGFVSHSTEFVLRAACRAARIPYVRTNKGRLASCLRALGRDLGLLA